MNLEESFYFRNMKHYSPKGTNLIYSTDILKDINDLSKKVRNTAKYALLEEISPDKAKKEISDLLETIKLLKKRTK